MKRSPSGRPSRRFVPYRPINQIMLAYRLLMTRPSRDRAKDGAFLRLKTLGEACRPMFEGARQMTPSWPVADHDLRI